MRARELLKILKDHGCVELRRNATHIQVLCGKCHTTVVDHKGEDIGKGLLPPHRAGSGAVSRKGLVEAMKAKAKYVARFERDEDGWWVVNVEGVQGCHTQGRTIEQGEARIREALGLYIGDAADTVEIETKVELPAPVRKAVDRSKAERARAQEAEEEAATATKAAVKAALAAGLSTRDAGALLGLTRQRVQQVASGG